MENIGTGNWYNQCNVLLESFECFHVAKCMSTDAFRNTSQNKLGRTGYFHKQAYRLGNIVLFGEKVNIRHHEQAVEHSTCRRCSITVVLLLRLLSDSGQTPAGCYNPIQRTLHLAIQIRLESK